MLNNTMCNFLYNYNHNKYQFLTTIFFRRQLSKLSINSYLDINLKKEKTYIK